MTDDHGKRIARHLEFFGYTPSGPGQGGSWQASHPRRWHVHFLATPLGLRLHGTVCLGPHVPVKSLAWTEFLNRFNEDSVLTRVTVSQDADGDTVLRAAALLPPRYERRLFGALLDAWHSDLEFLQHAPRRHEQVSLVPESTSVN